MPEKQSRKYQLLLELIKAGLWVDANLNHCVNPDDKLDWGGVYQLAEEQSVFGVVLAGIEHSNVKPPQELLLQWIGQVQMLEQQNKAMNKFVADLIEKLRVAGIYALLVKGQGIAQCYERPLWRSCGDVDLLLSEDDYARAKEFLLPLASSVGTEYYRKKHLGMTIDGWIVELHGHLYSGLSSRVDKGLDEIKNAFFLEGKVRSWMDGRTQVFLPDENEDVVYVFTHILQHFYKGGIGLRQICDWCRLLWTYKDSLNHELLESRLRKMGLMTEWKAFGVFAVDYLGMPVAAMPFYSSDKKWSRKAEKILEYVLGTGNFGHNRDYSFYRNKNYIKKKSISAWNRVKDLSRHAVIFPINSARFLVGIFFYGISSALRGE